LINLSRFILIRLDDIGRYEPNFSKIIEIFGQAKIKMSCAVVPTWLDVSTLSFFKAAFRKYPGMIEIHQHGYAHTNYSSDFDDKHEFGNKRNLEQQFNDINRGKLILQNEFGNIFFPAFTPPYGNYNENTITALRSLEFKVLSTFPMMKQKKQIVDLAPFIDCFSWDPIIEKPIHELHRLWRLENDYLKGFVMHPRLMEKRNLIKHCQSILELIDSDQTYTFAEIFREINNPK